MVWKKNLDGRKKPTLTSKRNFRKELLELGEEERLVRKRKRHSETVTRFYYRNRDRVLQQKRLKYLKNKGLNNDEIITQLLKKKTDLSNAKFDNLVV